MRNTEIESWVADVAGHTKPAAIHWCDGSREEAEELSKRMRASGALRSTFPQRISSKVDALPSIDPQSWLAEWEQNEAYLAGFQDRLPNALWDEHRSLRDRLRASIS